MQVIVAVHQYIIYYNLLKCTYAQDPSLLLINLHTTLLSRCIQFIQ